MTIVQRIRVPLGEYTEFRGYYQLMLDALLQMAHLKEQVRTGWTLRGVKQPESVADHSWATALLCLVYAPEAGVDRSRAVEIAVVHDLAEAITGDVPTRVATLDERTRAARKASSERTAMNELLQATDPVAAESIRSLWEEYEGRSTEEARFVRDMNLIDMCMQALTYERDGRHDSSAQDDGSGYPGLSEFFATSEPRLSTHVGRRLFRELAARYEELPGVESRGTASEPGSDQHAR